MRREREEKGRWEGINEGRKKEREKKGGDRNGKGEASGTVQLLERGGSVQTNHILTPQPTPRCHTSSKLCTKSSQTWPRCKHHTVSEAAAAAAAAAYEGVETTLAGRKMRLVSWAEPPTDGGGLRAIIDGKPTTPLLCRQTDRFSHQKRLFDQRRRTVSNCIILKQILQFANKLLSNHHRPIAAFHCQH